MDSSGFLRLSPSSGFCCPSQEFFVFLRPIPKFFVLLRPLLASSILLHPPPSFSVLIQPPPAFYGLSRVLRSHPLGNILRPHLSFYGFPQYPPVFYITRSPLYFSRTPHAFATISGLIRLLRLPSTFVVSPAFSSIVPLPPASSVFLQSHGFLRTHLFFSGLLRIYSLSQSHIRSSPPLSGFLHIPVSSIFLWHLPESSGLIRPSPASSIPLRPP